MEAMTVLSSKGQIVIPQKIREQLKWKPGQKLKLFITK
ncbi:AbrB/MazE/SpoVT family DNA-binding domain-containing protein, partial [Candidatus Bathyarchaeota archaeon]|nr:AbrB/MazE/SpoVT family DNA-binding domain-containing protein [Candidatus Bathyarchaeota archaeon]